MSMGVRRHRKGSRLCRRCALPRRRGTPRLHQILHATKCDKLSDSPNTSSGGVAKYASALSTETVNVANSLKYLLCVARCFVFFHRYSIGWYSGEYDGNGYSVRRSRWASKNACVAALV